MIGPIERWDDEYYVCACAVPPANVRLRERLFWHVWRMRSRHHWWMVDHSVGLL